MDTTDLIPTADVAEMLGKSVATINRWAAENKLVPAMEFPGKKGARMFRRSEVEALLAPSAPSEQAS